MAEEFTVGEWGGAVHYECASCPFDTFDGMEMLNHLVNEHNSEAALETLVSLEGENDGENNIGEDGGQGAVSEPAGIG